MDLTPLWDELDHSVLLTIARYRSHIAALNVRTKDDRTLVTDADAAIEDMIVGALRSALPDAAVVAEEAKHSSSAERRSKRFTWVVDPIDGTAQFVSPGAVEFASVVALLDDRSPIAAWILIPEGASGGPLRIRADSSTVSINGVNVTPLDAAPRPAVPSASVTGAESRLKDALTSRLGRHGVVVKTRATSQTVDMIRTCVDLRPFASSLDPMLAFFRSRQKIWDGAAGLAVAAAVGLPARNEHGLDPVPLALDLGETEPTLAATFVGRQTATRWYDEARLDATSLVP